MQLNFKFSEQETQTILNALSKEPYVMVVDVINKLQSQASEQMKQKEGTQ